MSSWAERVHRRAADFSNVVTSCGHPGSSAPTYPYRLEKVKFGVSLDEVCKNDNIPGPLLVLILKLNKESPNRRDVFRAPGHQGAMKKLIHFLQSGRLVNVDNYSVYTIASVLKKFLRKIPNGIFGRSGENELFAIIELSNEAEQNERLHKLFTSLPKYTQHLLVLLFGTFRVIASNAAHAGTGMTSEALGVSVAPSFFQSCVSDGKTARMEDVLKFKVATKIMKYIIDKFATHDLFGRENYEYYARVTGRILKVQDEWICSFQYPPPPRGKLAQQKYALQHSLEAEKTWLQCQCERWGLQGPGLFAMTSSPLPSRNKHEFQPDDEDDDLDENEYNDDDDDDDDNNGDNANGGGDNAEHDIANDLDLSSHNDDENIENQSKNANFHLTSSSTSTSAGKSRRTLKSRSSSNDAGGPASGDYTFTDSQDDVDGDEMMRCVVKRRYKQNKKKSPSTSNTAQIRGVQQQRRLRTSINKSIDTTHSTTTTTSSATTTTTTQHHNDYLNDYEFMGKSSTSTSTLKALTTTDPSLLTQNMQQKSRVCSRCKRGIRHSSSCSSSTASGGGGAAANGTVGGSGMTMDELKAFNRYAESTKSLSYLPQVHERQTARMRTRSEWFLGPKDDDDDVLCMANNTCSNCYLTVHGGENEMTASGSYLGGGSTRDMRRVDLADHRAAINTAGSGHAEAVNTSLYLYYKQQQQQQHQHQQRHHQLQAGQRQSFHLSPDFMMDTDDGYYHGGGSQATTTQQATTHSSSMQQPIQQHALTAAGHHQQLKPHTLAVTGGGAGLYLDTNYGIYDFDDTDILISANSTTTTTSNTTNTTPTTTSDNSYYHNNNNNNNKENNNDYTLKHRQHLMSKIIGNNNNNKTDYNRDITLKSQPSLSSVSSSSFNKPLSQQQQQQLHAFPQNNTNNNNSSNNNNNHHQRHMSQYYSTESLLSNHKSYLDVNCGPDHEIDELPCCSTSTLASKLSYHSLRDVEKRHDMDDGNDDVDDDELSLMTSSNANLTNTSTSTTTNNTTSSNVPPSSLDEHDYMLGPSYRHSTPMMQQRRRLQRQTQALRRQRVNSNSSSLYQSFNASLQAPMTSANRGHFSNSRNSYHNESRSLSSSRAGGGGGSGGVTGGNASSTGVTSSSSNNNFVSIVFNVLDFLF
ncbi:rho GTPase activating protein at 71E isoform X3 [Musca autumnalis]|uniref:rho GTPase activating protein at 71E isoform X3 n=1 Tax=Musca autumnalis TaxID=221902 RepID=UPI003CF6032F